MDRKQKIEQIMADFIAFKRKAMLERHRGGNHPNITPAQGQALLIIHHHHAITTSDLAKILGVTVSAATQLCENLVEADYLIKEDSPDDGRSFTLRLSDKTKRYVIKMKRDSISQMSTLFDALNDKELDQFLKLSNKIIQNLN